MSWIRGIPGVSDSLTTGHHILLCHYFDVVLPLEDMLLFVKVDQSLVKRLIEQLEMLLAFLNIAVFPEPVLSSAYVVQHIRDSVVA